MSNTFNIGLAFRRETTVQIRELALDCELHANAAALIFFDEETGWDYRVVSEPLPEGAQPSALALPGGEVISFGEGPGQSAIDSEILTAAVLAARLALVDERQQADAIEAAIASQLAQRAQHRRETDAEVAALGS